MKCSCAGLWSAALRETASWAPVPDSDPPATHSGQARPDQGPGEIPQSSFASRVCRDLVDVEDTPGHWLGFVLCGYHRSSKCFVGLLIIEVSKHLPK